ncbi:AbrB/MazE/SpoVT family DNA-binding domain-containing protein [Candidatus Pacearchaeota archaeon]|nr:AbrB/MazE/SpoVT family DNA-binding domain-containing protein [Candidatus Pacearchaeota archaeon]
MKVMKVVDKKVGNTTYYKYRINLPKEAVEQLNLFDKELKVKVEKNKIVIEKA